MTAVACRTLNEQAHLFQRFPSQEIVSYHVVPLEKFTLKQKKDKGKNHVSAIKT